MKCPRRTALSNVQFPEEDTWRADNTCSYCGSYNPDLLVKRIDEETVELGPTDKNYKVYLKNVGGDPIGLKFYWPHFSMEQQMAFVGAMNSKRVKIGAPGHFYVMPYFMGR